MMCPRHSISYFSLWYRGADREQAVYDLGGFGKMTCSCHLLLNRKLHVLFCRSYKRLRQQCVEHSAINFKPLDESFNRGPMFSSRSAAKMVGRPRQQQWTRQLHCLLFIVFQGPSSIAKWHSVCVLPCCWHQVHPPFSVQAGTQDVCCRPNSAMKIFSLGQFHLPGVRFQCLLYTVPGLLLFLCPAGFQHLREPVDSKDVLFAAWSFHSSVAQP